MENAGTIRHASREERTVAVRVGHVHRIHVVVTAARLLSRIDTLVTMIAARDGWRRHARARAAVAAIVPTRLERRGGEVGGLGDRGTLGVRFVGPASGVPHLGVIAPAGVVIAPAVTNVLIVRNRARDSVALLVNVVVVRIVRLGAVVQHLEEEVGLGARGAQVYAHVVVME